MRLYLPCSRDETQSLRPFRAQTWSKLLGNIHHFAADRGGAVLGDRYQQIELTTGALADVAVILCDSQPSQEHWYARPLWAATGLRRGVAAIEWRIGFADGLGAVTWSETWRDQLDDRQFFDSRGTRETDRRSLALEQWNYPGEDLGCEASRLPIWGAVREHDQTEAGIGFDGRTLHVQARIARYYNLQRFWLRGLSVWGSVHEGMV